MKRFALSAMMFTGAVVSPLASVCAQTAPVDVKGLPIQFMPPKGKTSPYTAVVMSGDGGFATLVNKLTEGLNEAGIGVVGFNSSKWLSPAKTPDQSADAVVRAIRASMARYNADSIIIVGYSRGADMAPFVGNRLPADLRAVLGGIAMFGLATSAGFEFHMIDMIKDTKRDTDIPILPELKKLQGVPMVCVYGSDEKESGCRGVPEGLMRVVQKQGGHHFDGEDKALADDVLKLVKIIK